MDFPEFARKTHLILDPGSSTSAFTRTLFEWVLPDDKISLIDNYSDNTFKAYYNGHTQITKIAQIVFPHIENGIYFEENIGDIEDSIAIALCDAFNSDIPDTTPFNITAKLGEFFSQIIKEATISQGNTVASQKKEENTKAQQILNHPTIVNQYGETCIHIDHVDTIKF